MAAIEEPWRYPPISDRMTTAETEIDAHKEAFDSFKADVKDAIADLKGDMRGLRTAVIAFAFTVAGSSVGLAITMVLTRGGK